MPIVTPPNRLSAPIRGTADSRASIPTRVLLAGLVVGGFTLVILGSASQDFLYYAMHSGETKTFWPSVRWPAFYWYLWALLTPVVFALARRYPLGGKRSMRHLGVLVVGCIGVFALHVALQVAAMALPFYNHLHEDLADAVSFHLFSSIQTNLITFWLIVGAWYAGNYYHSSRMQEIQNVDLEAQLARAELRSLKMQIHPHFLFNTLHGISELMHRDVAAAERTISDLSELLRTSIDHSSDQFVRLEDEMAFVKKYVDIEQIRFADRLEVRVDVADDVRGALIPSFVLQPFVENAIKHGVATHSRQAHVSIAATLHDGRLRLEVVDDGPGAASPIVRGIGIDNVARRLDHLFGKDYELRIAADSARDGRLENAVGGFRITLDLPLLPDEQQASTVEPHHV